MPVEVLIQVMDDNGDVVESKTILPNTDPKSEKTVIEPFRAEFKGTKGRFVRALGKSRGNCPAWHPGAGDTCWIFADEVVVE